MKIIIIFIISILIVLLLSTCEKNTSEDTQEQYIISTDGVMSAQFYQHSDGSLHKVLNYDIKIIIDILNTAQYDNDRNDGKMFKMEAPSFEIIIRYNDNTEVSIMLLDNIMYVNRTWYQLDIKNIKKIFSKYNKKT